MRSFSRMVLAAVLGVATPAYAATPDLTRERQSPLYQPVLFQWLEDDKEEPAPPAAPLPAPPPTPAPGNIGAPSGIQALPLETPAPRESNAAPPPPGAGPPSTAALLLPLSGASATIGQQMLNAAELAVFELGDAHFTLRVLDAGATPASAIEAYKRAAERGAQLVIGPLFAKQAEALRPHLQEGTPAVTLSNDATLAGKNMIVFGLAPGEQAQKIAEYAVKRGYRRFAALLPDTPYGRVVEAAFRAGLGEGSGNLALARYTDGSDLESLSRQIYSAGAPDAVFLPEGGGKLRALLAALQKAGMDPLQTRLLGTGLWDDPDVLQLTEMQGAWFAAPAPDARQIFVQRYEEHFGNPPPRIATLAYDSVAMAAALAAGDGEITALELFDPQGFAGTDGLFRVRNNFFVERSLAVLEIGNGAAQPLEAAATRFSN